MSVNDECYKSLQIISALERHTLNGRHLCPNRIVIDLIYNLRKQIESIHLKSGTEVPSINKYLHGNTFDTKYLSGKTVDASNKISSSSYKINDTQQIQNEDNVVVIEKYRRSLVKLVLLF